MLVLSRKTNGKIVLHRQTNVVATITVVEVSAGRVRLGFSAADDLEIDRIEVFENKCSSSS